MFTYDPMLLAAVDATPKNMTDVLRTLHTIDATCADGDGLKWFNWLYMEVTQAVADRVAAGGFTDPAWMAALDVHFAALYFSALKSSLRGTATPGCWQVLFTRRSEVLLARIQFAAAGINAHIDHDLAEAIVRTCADTGVSPDRHGVHYADYTSLNGTLDGLVNLTKQKLHLRLLGELLPPVSHLEDTLAGWGVAAARENAWFHAERMWALRGVPGFDWTYLHGLDYFATVAGKLLMVPVPLR